MTRRRSRATSSGSPASTGTSIDPSVYVRAPGPPSAAAATSCSSGRRRRGRSSPTPRSPSIPELTYVRARTRWPSHRRRGAGRTRARARTPRSLERFPGSELVGTRYEPPFDFIPGSDYGEKGHTVLAADFVTAEDGTGLVHTAIAFGEDDFRLGEQQGLNVDQPGAARRHLRRADRRLRRAARSRTPTRDLIEDLRGRGRLLRAETYEHSYPHCWRCDTPLLYYAKPSWYIATSQIKDRLLGANETVNWHPDARQARALRQLAGGQRRLGAVAASATGARRCRCGAARTDMHAGDRLAGRARAELAGSRSTDPHRPFVDDVTFPCSTTAAGRCTACPR